MKNNLVLAAKCAPVADKLDLVRDAGIQAVELYLSARILSNLRGIIKLCRKYDFTYALHAPNDCHAPVAVAQLADEIGARVAVMHDIFWEDEWRETAEAFKNSSAKVCVENIRCVHDPEKFMRRLNFGMCFDLEHVQMECSGFYEAAFADVAVHASHIHLTGYYHGSQLWHTHMHRSPEHAVRVLDMLSASGYHGLVVSEASTQYQTAEEFATLRSFFRAWQKVPGSIVIEKFGGGAEPAMRRPLADDDSHFRS
jgi:sugar phosphate isomerase/epimerase